MLCVCTFSFGLSRKKKIPKRKGPRLRLRCYSDTAIRRRGSNSLRSDSEFFQHNANSRKLSIATPPVDVSENKYFPALNGFAGGGKRKGIGYREKDAMYGCAGMEDYRIW